MTDKRNFSIILNKKEITNEELKKRLEEALKEKSSKTDIQVGNLNVGEYLTSELHKVNKDVNELDVSDFLKDNNIPTELINVELKDFPEELMLPSELNQTGLIEDDKGQTFMQVLDGHLMDESIRLEDPSIKYTMGGPARLLWRAIKPTETASDNDKPNRPPEAPEKPETPEKPEAPEKPDTNLARLRPDDENDGYFDGLAKLNSIIVDNKLRRTESLPGSYPDDDDDEKNETQTFTQGVIQQILAAKELKNKPWLRLKGGESIPITIWEDRAKSGVIFIE